MIEAGVDIDIDRVEWGDKKGLVTLVNLVK